MIDSFDHYERKKKLIKNKIVENCYLRGDLSTVLHSEIDTIS